MAELATSQYKWLRTGDEAYAAMLAAIGEARSNVRMETYIFTDSRPGHQFLDALIQARKRGVEVRLLVDAFGSIELSDEFWDPLREAGGTFRWFNPLEFKRLGIRDHRKLLVCDEATAFIGGFNISSECEGDGITRGWRDHGLEVRSPLVPQLARAFDESFNRADLKHHRLAQYLKSRVKQSVVTENGVILLSGPGIGVNPIKSAMRDDLKRAVDVRIVAAYFLPTWRIRRELTRVPRRGGRVQLIVAEKSDVPLSRLACRCLYPSLLAAGVEIYEYQPQILHAKLLIIGDVVYAGSANLDARSLNINYELMLRLRDPGLTAGARDIFGENLRHSRRVDRQTWRASRTFWSKLKEQWAYFILARVDPYIARRQLKALR
jgi:cardiolipin synthase